MRAEFRAELRAEFIAELRAEFRAEVRVSKVYCFKGLLKAV